MIKVAFFLDCMRSGPVDCCNLLSGNPGIGGTEYEFALVASEISKHRERFCVSVISNGSFVFPGNVEVFKVGSGTADELYDAAAVLGCKILVLDARLDVQYFRRFQSSSVKLVAWSHLFLNFKKLNALNAVQNLSSLVCVGREQLDLFRDHDAFRKATYIYNACPVSAEVSRVSAANLFRDRAPIVTYMGSLTPNKGFHLLADAWAAVVKRNPLAQLHVIGSGRLYSKDAELGPLGLAEAVYEERFTAPLRTSDGRLMSSVHFHGVMGSDKWDVLCKTKVGVPNPSGISETFGISAVEMMMAGALIVTKRCPGFLDTVFETGLLYRDVGVLADGISKKLSEPDNRFEDCLEFIISRFGVETVIEKWEQLLVSVSTGMSPTHEAGLVNPFFRAKWLREINRILRRVIPFALPICRIEELGYALRGRLKCKRR